MDRMCRSLTQSRMMSLALCAVALYNAYVLFSKHRTYRLWYRDAQVRGHPNDSGSCSQFACSARGTANRRGAAADVESMGEVCDMLPHTDTWAYLSRARSRLSNGSFRRLYTSHGLRRQVSAFIRCGCGTYTKRRCGCSRTFSGLTLGYTRQHMLCGGASQAP